MKFLDSTPELELLARALNFTAPGVKVSSRIEAYTIKPLARDRALFKRLDAELQADLHLNASPPLQATTGGSSESGAFGPLDRRENRKTLWLLIGTLNLAHPDHDFSGLTAVDFMREPSSRVVLSQLSTALGHLRQSGSAYVGSSSPPKYSTSMSSLSSSAGTCNLVGDDVVGPAHPILRQVLDPIIDLDDCEVYSYAPDFDSDPHNGESDSEDEAIDSDSSDEAGLDGEEIDEGLAWPMDGISRPSPRSLRRRSGIVVHTQSPLATFAATKRSLSMLSLSESTGGLLWSSNYFFLNRKKKRLLFISLWARSTDGVSSVLGESLAPASNVPPLKRVRCAV